MQQQGNRCRSSLDVVHKSLIPQLTYRTKQQKYVLFARDMIESIQIGKEVFFMATISFTRNMELNKKESKALLKMLDSDSSVKHKVKTPPAERATKESLDKLFSEE